MPVVDVATPASARKQPRYVAHRRIYSTSSGDRPGLEDDILALPRSLLESFRSFCGAGTEPQFVRGDVIAHTPTEIQTEPGYVITDTAIYYIEPLTLTPALTAFRGVYELELTDELSDEFVADFYDATRLPKQFQDTAYFARAYRVRLRENYSETAAAPAPAGYIPWIEYQRDGAGGSILEARRVIPRVFEMTESGNLILPRDPDLAQAAATKNYTDVQSARAAAEATAGRLSGGLAKRGNNPPTILAGRYEVGGQLVAARSNIILSWLENNAGDSAAVENAHYLVSLREDGTPLIRLYYGDRIAGPLSIEAIQDAGGGLWDLQVPNSAVLSDVIVGGIAIARDTEDEGNRGLFNVTAFDDAPDSAAPGRKYIRVSNSRGAAQVAPAGTVDVHYRAESESDIADTDLYNPALSFDESRNQYFDEYQDSIGHYARVIGAFFVSPLGSVERVYALGNGREWQEAESLPVGVPIPIPFSHCPPWAIDADGRQDLPRDRYRRLFDRLGTAFGEGDGATTFGIFDLRGNVIRGQDRGRNRDPNASTRRARGDGQGGDVPGSEQDDEVKSHSHGFHDWVPNSGTNYLIHAGHYWLGFAATNTHGAGGSESRMRNISMRYIVKY